MAYKKSYVLTTTYADGSVSRFNETAESLLYELANRIHSREQYDNVNSWHIECVTEWKSTQDEQHESP